MKIPRPGDEATTVGLVSGGHFLSHFYLLTFPPLFPLLRSEFALNNTELGFLVSVISIAMLLQIPVGELVDRTGAKWVFVAGVALTSLGVLLAGVATSYLALLAFATLSGIGQSTFHPADYPLVETVSAPERRGKNFSVHTFGGYVGFAVAPLLVGTLGLTYGWRTALFAVGAVGLVYAVVSALVLRPAYRAAKESAPEQADQQSASSRDAFFRPAILIMFVYFAVIAMASRGIQTFTPILAVDGFQLREVVGNTALSVFFALTAVTIPVGGVFADRFDPRYVIAAATTTAAILVLVTVGSVLPVTATAFVVLFGGAGAAYGMVFASRDRLVSTYAADGSTGRSFGFVFTASSLGSVLSPILLGAAIDIAAASLAFVLVGGFFFLGGLVVLAIGTGRASLVTRLSLR